MTESREYDGVVISDIWEQIISHEVKMLGMEPKLIHLSPSAHWKKDFYYLEEKTADIGLVVCLLDEKTLIATQSEYFCGMIDYLLQRIKALPHVVFYRKGFHDNLREYISYIIHNAKLCNKCLYLAIEPTNYNWLARDADWMNESVDPKSEVIFLTKDSTELEPVQYTFQINKDIHNATIVARMTYFFDVVLPALFLADNKTWELLLRSNEDEILLTFQLLGSVVNHFFDVHFKSAQLSMWDIFADENIDVDDNTITDKNGFVYLDKHNVIGLRNQLLLTSEDYDLLRRNIGEERAKCICGIIRNKCSVGGKLHILARVIVELLQMDEYGKRVINDDKWNQFTYKSFEDCLVDQLINSDSYIYSIAKKAVETFGKLHETEFNLIPYSDKLDISVYLRKEFGNSPNNVVFKRYVIEGEDFVDEFEELVFLFQEYVSKVRGIDISFEKNNTSDGVVFTISSRDKRLVKENFSRMLEEFTTFMTFCGNEEERARRTLSDYGLDEEKIDYYISRFKIRTLRILNDCRHEYERKMLNNRQETENEALEESFYQFKEKVHAYNIPTELPLECKENYGVINYVFNSTGTVIEGDINYNKVDQDLLSCLKRYADNYEELVHEFNMLKSQTTPVAQKQTAFTKIKRFLSDHSIEIGEATVRVLLDYLPKLIGG